MMKVFFIRVWTKNIFICFTSQLKKQDELNESHIYFLIFWMCIYDLMYWGFGWVYPYVDALFSRHLIAVKVCI